MEREGSQAHDTDMFREDHVSISQREWQPKGGMPFKAGLGTNTSLIPNEMTPIWTLADKTAAQFSQSVLTLETWMLTHSIRISVTPAKSNAQLWLDFDGRYLARSSPTGMVTAAIDLGAKRSTAVRPLTAWKWKPPRPLNGEKSLLPRGHYKPPTIKIEGGTCGGSGTDCGAVQPLPTPTYFSGKANDGSRPLNLGRLDLPPGDIRASVFRNSPLRANRFVLFLQPSSCQPCRHWWSRRLLVTHRGEKTVPILTASPSRDISRAPLSSLFLSLWVDIFSKKKLSTPAPASHIAALCRRSLAKNLQCNARPSPEAFSCHLCQRKGC